MPEDDVPVDGASIISLLHRCFYADYLEEGGKEKDIPKPDRYQDTVDTFTTVASNLSELAEVCCTL